MFAVIAPFPAAPQSGPGYWALSRGPLASLALVAPLLILYEAGVVWLGPQAIRNGADLWLRGLLDTLGFGQYFLLPLLTVVALLVWHHLSGAPWRLPPRVCGGMLLECAVLAVCLVGIAQLQGTLLPKLGVKPPATPQSKVAGRTVATSHNPFVVPPSGGPFVVRPLGGSGQDPQLPVCATSVGTGESRKLGRLVAFLGAGIYEEALFRLLLLPAVAAALRWLGVPRWPSVLWSAAITSVFFALAHYLGPHGDAWQAYSFVFRTLAGGFFALLFVYRGFGVAAGAHAGYDILVGLG